MGDVLVLCYHAVSRDWPSELAVTPEALERQVGGLVRRGYRPMTFAQAMRAPAPRTLAITFDDAYRSTLDLALPVLRELGAPASVYAPTDWVGRADPMSWPGIEQWVPGPHAHELRCLDWDGLRALAQAGWEIGSHTCSHPHLTRLDDDALAHELRASRAAVAAELGACTTIAYPYGDVDARVVRAAAAAGYEAAGALPAVPHAPDPLAWPRIGVYPVDDARRFALKTSRLVRRARRLARR